MNPGSLLSVIVVTGLSGSGKSTALRVFEDMGFFCVDGLPVSMMPKLTTLFQTEDGPHRGLVLGMDLRQRDFIDDWYIAINELGKQGVALQIVFLESRLDILVRRFATTRRPHPMESQNLGLDQALEEERQLLEPIRLQADLVVDTSNYSIHDLRRVLQDKWVVMEQQGKGMRVHVISFGFKYGPPIEADLIFDLRFLPNPYFVKELRDLSGKDKPIVDYVLGSKQGAEFHRRLVEFLTYLLPNYAEEGRFRVTIAIGCTGGRHRSVAIAESVYQTLKDLNYAATIEHRHLELG